jgi:hypothetical protein
MAIDISRKKGQHLQTRENRNRAANRFAGRCLRLLVLA